jgi:ribosomal protein L11 methyltransferase
VTVRAYTPVDRGTPRRRARVEAGIRLLALLMPFPPLEARILEEADWQKAWKAHLVPLRIGRRLVVCPVGVAYDPRAGDMIITLDPGMAFGTGHHPTTRLCLEELEQRLKPGMRVLDLGTGSGILALVAAKMGAAEVLAVDRDPDAVRAARRNVRANGLGRRVRLLRSDGPPWGEGGIDMALANISAKVLMNLAEALAGCMAPGATLVASGLLVEREPEVTRAIIKAGMTLVGRRQEEDWVALVCRRASP